MEYNNKLSLLVSTHGYERGFNRAGDVLRCSKFPGFESDFEKVYFQKIIWPGKTSSDEEWKIAENLIKKLKECDDCPKPSVAFPFKEVLKENNKYITTNRSFIHFDFCGLPKEMIDGILCRETEYKPINCDDLTVILDERGIDKRFANERFFEKHRFIDVRDPTLHAHSAIRTCYLENETIDYASSVD